MPKDFIRLNIARIGGLANRSLIPSQLQRLPRSLNPDRPNYQSSPQKLINQLNDLSPNKRNKKIPTTVTERVSQLEAHLAHIHHDNGLMQQLQEIRSDIKMIKSCLFEDGFKLDKIDRVVAANKVNTQGSTQEQSTFQTTYNHNVPQLPAISQSRLVTNGQNENPGVRMRSQSSDNGQPFRIGQRIKNSPVKLTFQELISQHTRKQTTFSKDAISMKTVASIAREYRIQGPDFGTLFYGYSKRNSHSVVLKYIQHNLSIILEIYDRLWKGIVQVQWPCINRVYNYRGNQGNLLIIDRNKSHATNIPPRKLMVNLLRILELFHDNGYLYRNLEPEHLMLNDQQQLVLIDFKRVHRYVDIKGHPIEVVDNFNGSLFASNNQVRGLSQSRKDDLQSLGYLALPLLGLDIPWYRAATKQEVIRIRSSITLQDLYSGGGPNKGYPKVKWIEYMVTVLKTGPKERPDYKKLREIIESSEG